MKTDVPPPWSAVYRMLGLCRYFWNNKLPARTLQHRHRRRGKRPARHQPTRLNVLICIGPVCSAPNEWNESIVSQLEAIDQRLGRNNAPNRRPAIALASDNVNLSTEIADQRSSRTFPPL